MLQSNHPKRQTAPYTYLLFSSNYPEVTYKPQNILFLHDDSVPEVDLHTNLMSHLYGLRQQYFTARSTPEFKYAAQYRMIFHSCKMSTPSCKLPSLMILLLQHGQLHYNFKRQQCKLGNPPYVNYS